VTYPDLAQALRARILADLKAGKVADPPCNRPDPDGRRIATLEKAVAKAEALSEQRRQEAESSAKRANDLVAELVEMTSELDEMSKRMAEQTVTMDKVRAEFDDFRSRSWWWKHSTGYAWIASRGPPISFQGYLRNAGDLAAENSLFGCVANLGGKLLNSLTHWTGVLYLSVSVEAACRGRFRLYL
jgi:hypothetical protein